MPEFKTQAVLKAIETLLLTKLAPLTEAGGGKLRNIRVIDVSGTPEQQAEIVDKLLDQAPAGFLSLPVLRFDGPQNMGVQAKLDLTATYIFVSITEATREGVDRFEVLFGEMDKLINVLENQLLDLPAGFENWENHGVFLDRVAPADAVTKMILYAQFSIRLNGRLV